MIDANGYLWLWQVIASKQGFSFFVFLQSVNVRAYFAQGTELGKLQTFLKIKIEKRMNMKI